METSIKDRALVDQMVKLRNALKSQRSSHEGDWADCLELFMPTRWGVTGDFVPGADELYDSEGRRASETMSSGLTSMIFPREEIFFEYGQQAGSKRSEQAIRWFRSKSAVTMSYLHRSNFFEEVQVAIKELCVVGTCCLFISDYDEESGKVFFKNQPCFSYYIAEDAKGTVDTVIRELKLTPNQAADEFGVTNLPKKVADYVGTAKGESLTHLYSHCCIPNRLSKADLKGSKADKKRPYRDIVILESEKHVVRDSGYNSFPFAVCRYGRASDSVWGYGPGTLAKGDAFQCEALNQIADVATEKMVWPSLLASSKSYGVVDNRPGGITYIDTSDPNGGADNYKEWGSTNIRLDVPLKRLEDKHAAIRAAFFVDLFKLFTQRMQQSREMTATEASLMSQESIAQFAPVGSRIQSELMDNIFIRLFAVLYSAPGVFWTAEERPPEDLFPKGGKTGIAVPAVSYKNKITLRLSVKQNGALGETMNGLAPILQASPELLDNFDLDEAARDYSRNTGIPESWIRPVDARKKMRDERAQAQAQQAQLQQAQQAASAAKDAAAANIQIPGQ